jgi:hypothetical protein
MGLMKSDHNKGLVTLTVITISGFHCKMNIGHLHKLVTKINRSIPSMFFCFFKYFFGVPHLATFIFFFNEYVIASIAYIHLVYGGI